MKKDPLVPSKTIYDRVFLVAFLANICKMIAVSLLFRYADFVQESGGNEMHLGWIVGLGTCGAILFRLVQGVAIDRLGPVWIWISSLLLMLISLYWHVQITTVDSWQVYIARFILYCGIAGGFASWLSFVTIRVPLQRTAEAIGVIGVSGFIGMAIGPTIGDLIFAEGVNASSVDQMFYVSGAFIAGCLVCVLLAAFLNQTELRQHENQDRVSLWNLLKTSNPGFLLIVALVMGMSISLPGTFLRPMAQGVGIEQIGIFFWTYNGVAFVSRLLFRKAPQIFGIRTLILVGLAAMALSQVLYSTVGSYWALILPAAMAGLAHSFLFPSVVAGGTAFFPKANRGTATSLMLGMYDVGVLIGSPLFGASLIINRKLDWPEYPVTFFLVALAVALTGLTFAYKYPRCEGMLLKRRGEANG